MSKIGKYEYPEVYVSTLLKDVEKLIEKFDGFANDEKMFATSLGHKTNQSGSFTTKLASLRKYGLIEPRELKATSLAKRIIKPLNKEERIKSMTQMIANVELWIDLYNRLKTKTPSKEDFKIALVELTNERDKSIDKSTRIESIFTEAISYYKEETINLNSSSASNEIEKTQEEKENKKVPENLILLKSGEFNVTLPKTDSNIEILKDILDGMKPAGTQPVFQAGHPEEPKQKKQKSTSDPLF